MKTIIIYPEHYTLLSESAKTELNLLFSDQDSLKKRCLELISTFQYNRMEHRTDTGLREFNYAKTPQAILTVDRWVKTAGEEWGNCVGCYYLLVSVGLKYVHLEADHYRTSENNWSEFRTIDLESFLPFLCDWKSAEDCGEPADRDMLMKKLSAKISNFFQ